MKHSSMEYSTKHPSSIKKMILLRSLLTPITILILATSVLAEDNGQWVLEKIVAYPPPEKRKLEYSPNSDNNFSLEIIHSGAFCTQSIKIDRSNLKGAQICTGAWIPPSAVLNQGESIKMAYELSTEGTDGNFTKECNISTNLSISVDNNGRSLTHGNDTECSPEYTTDKTKGHCSGTATWTVPSGKLGQNENMYISVGFKSTYGRGCGATYSYIYKSKNTVNDCSAVDDNWAKDYKTSKIENWMKARPAGSKEGWIIEKDSMNIENLTDRGRHAMRLFKDYEKTSRTLEKNLLSHADAKKQISEITVGGASAIKVTQANADLIARLKHLNVVIENDEKRLLKLQSAWKKNQFDFKIGPLSELPYSQRKKSIVKVRDEKSVYLEMDIKEIKIRLRRLKEICSSQQNTLQESDSSRTNETAVNEMGVPHPDKRVNGATRSQKTEMEVIIGY